MSLSYNALWRHCLDPSINACDLFLIIIFYIDKRPENNNPVILSSEVVGLVFYMTLRKKLCISAQLENVLQDAFNTILTFCVQGNGAYINQTWLKYERTSLPCDSEATCSIDTLLHPGVVNVACAGLLMVLSVGSMDACYSDKLSTYTYFSFGSHKSTSTIFIRKNVWECSLHIVIYKKTTDLSSNTHSEPNQENFEEESLGKWIKRCILEW